MVYILRPYRDIIEILTISIVVLTSLKVRVKMKNAVVPLDVAPFEGPVLCRILRTVLATCSGLVGCWSRFAIGISTSMLITMLVRYISRHLRNLLVHYAHDSQHRGSFL